MKAKIISPLIKVFPDMELEADDYLSASALGGEYFDLQIAYFSEFTQTDISLVVESDIKEIEFGMVGFAVSEMPSYPDHDEYVLRDTPGIYPDPIHMVTGNKDIEAVAGQWRSLYVTIKANVKYSGMNTIRFIFKNGDGEEQVTLSFCLEIINKNLPKQKTLHTEWFHFDCLATWYHTDVFSEKHWELLENYIENYAKHGMNMVLTPLFTPALDTEVGGERPTVQLVEIEKNNGKYKFNFDRLVRWFRLCQKHGVEYFELCHFYTQWGAHNAPKIIVKEDGKDKQAFGWHTNAHEQEYKEFLAAFVPELIKVIEQENLGQKCYFHISDEPFEAIFDVYKSASKMLKTLTGNYPIMDALSDYRFYEEHLLDVPVVASDHIHTFIEKKVDNLWVYYCCAQMNQVSNRSFNMSGSRTRIIGVQMYKFDIKGFLHWGYNYWYSGRSKNQKLNPYLVSDAGHAFPSGDAFLVYPHPYGDTIPVNSIRIKYMRQAMQDIRALQLLESFVGKERVMELLEEDSVTIDFKNYERDDNWILKMRERINGAIKSC